MEIGKFSAMATIDQKANRLKWYYDENLTFPF